MKEKVETGNAINVANFQALIMACTELGASYNPKPESLSIAELTNLKGKAQTAMNNNNEKQVALTQAIALRKAAFEPLSQLATRIFNAYKISGASDGDVDGVLTVIRKLQGRRAKTLPSAPTLPVGGTPTPATKSRSVSFQSFESRTSNFALLVEYLLKQPLYDPNEEALKVVTLQNVLKNLQDTQTDVLIAENAIATTRAQRDEILYNKTTGLVKRALNVKDYIKSLFGASSVEFKRINEIHFTSKG
jgi:hypothetical protein